MHYHRIASANSIKEGEMTRVDCQGHQLAIAHVAGEFYAFSDRCAHMNVSLSRGKLKNHVVTCPLHRATFDIKTGEKLSDPKIPAPKMIKMVDLMASIETTNIPVYSVKQEDGELYVQLPE